MISFTREKLELTAKGLGGKGAVDVEGWEKRALPSAGEPSWEGKCRWERLSGGLERPSWKFSDALLVEGSVKVNQVNKDAKILNHACLKSIRTFKKTPHTCITGAGLWGVASIGERSSFLVAVSRRQYVVLLHLRMGLSFFGHLAIFEVLL